jgi:hypothetical protein
MIRILRAYSKAYENVTFKISDVSSQTEQDRIKDKNEQDLIKGKINKLVAYNYHKDNSEVKTI